MECRTEAAECAFVVDNILINSSGQGSASPQFGNIAVLYRRQVSAFDKFVTVLCCFLVFVLTFPICSCSGGAYDHTNKAMYW